MNTNDWIEKNIDILRVEFEKIYNVPKYVFFDRRSDSYRSEVSDPFDERIDHADLYQAMFHVFCGMFLPAYETPEQYRARTGEDLKGDNAVWWRYSMKEEYRIGIYSGLSLDLDFRTAVPGTGKPKE